MYIIYETQTDVNGSISHVPPSLLHNTNGRKASF